MENWDKEIIELFENMNDEPFHIEKCANYETCDYCNPNVEVEEWFEEEEEVDIVPTKIFDKPKKINDKVKVERMVRKCMNVLKKKEYELDLTKAHVDRAVKLTKVVDRKWSMSGNRAGANSININLSYWQYRKDWDNKDKQFNKIEYANYSKDKVIGSRPVKNMEEALWISVAHEVAHHVQYAQCPRIKRFRKNYRKPHGDCFKTIYRYLRKDFINPMLDA